MVKNGGIPQNFEALIVTEMLQFRNKIVTYIVVDQHKNIL